MNLTPYILTPVIGLVIGWLAGRLNNGQVEIKALKKGLQALLRDRLLQSYKHHEAKGYATVEDRENWINMYNQYHDLGVNGVMDDIKEKFLDLPTSKQ